MSLPLRVLVADERGRPAAAPGLARWLAGVAPSRVRGTVNIALVSDATVRELNRRYRGVDDATDVLSFPGRRVTPGHADRPRPFLWAISSSPGAWRGVRRARRAIPRRLSSGCWRSMAFCT